MAPDGWQNTLLGDCCKVQGGFAFKSKDFTDSGVPVIRISNIKSGGIDLTKNTAYLPESYLPINLNFVVKKGDILMALSGATTGKFGKYQSETPVLFNQRVGRFKVLYEQKLHEGYLYQILHGISVQVLEQAYGAAQPNISTKDLERFPLLLPLLSEQKKIAAILSSVDDAIQSTQAVIDQTRRVKQGLMQQLLTRGIGHNRFKQTEIGEIPEEWDVVQLSDIGTLSSGSTPLRREKSYFCNTGGHYWVKTMDLTDGIVLQTDEKITDKALAETSCKLNSPGTIMIAMYGGFKQIGRTGILKMSAATNQAICCIDLNRNRENPEFCNIWLVGNRYRWKTIAASSRKDPNITKKDVSQFPLPLPTIEEQQNIVTIFQSLDNQLFSAESELKLLKLLKRGLMQDLLTGRVRVKLDGEATT